jgi:hypothetical protein
MLIERLIANLCHRRLKQIQLKHLDNRLEITGMEADNVFYGSVLISSEKEESLNLANKQTSTPHPFNNK